MLVDGQFDVMVFFVVVQQVVVVQLYVYFVIYCEVGVDVEQCGVVGQGYVFYVEWLVVVGECQVLLWGGVVQVVVLVEGVGECQVVFGIQFEMLFCVQVQGGEGGVQVVVVIFQGCGVIVFVEVIVGDVYVGQFGEGFQFQVVLVQCVGGFGE